MTRNETARTSGFTTPVTAGGAVRALVNAVGRGLWKMCETVLMWQERYRQRQELLSLDDHLLKDIGISRADAEREASKPFWKYF